LWWWRSVSAEGPPILVDNFLIILLYPWLAGLPLLVVGGVIVANELSKLR
jgi:hypothetical protein